jgi:predicted TIM-barrel fold metal-dependent hydrolase
MGKKIFRILPVILLLVTGILIGWFLYQKQINSTQKNTSQTTTEINFPIIDAHAHLSWNNREETILDALTLAAQITKKNGADFTIIVPPPFIESMPGKFDLEELKKIDDEDFGFGAGGGSLNIMIQNTPTDQVTDDLKEKFHTTAEQIAASGALVFGETTALHFSLGANHPFEETSSIHPLFLELADVAAEYNIPIDLHMEAVVDDRETPEKLLSASSANSPHLLANIPALEELLDYNKNTKIIWAHAGWDHTDERTVALMRKLLANHSNLHMSLKTGNDCLSTNFPLEENGQLKEEWLKLLTDFADRFVIGSDQFFSTPGSQIKYRSDHWENEIKVLELLPREVAEKIAYQNAEKIFNLNLKN